MGALGVKKKKSAKKGLFNISKKFIVVNLIGFIVTLIVALIPGYFSIKSHLLQFENADLIMKQRAQIDLTEDVLAVNRILLSKSRLCISKKYSSLEKLHDELINSMAKIVSDTNKYRIIFGNEALQKIVDNSRHANDFIRENEHLMESCSKESMEALDPDKFGNNIRRPLDLEIFSQSKTLRH